MVRGNKVGECESTSILMLGKSETNVHMESMMDMFLIVCSVRLRIVISKDRIWNLGSVIKHLFRRILLTMTFKSGGVVLGIIRDVFIRC